jgi:hypothetical protein
MTKRTHRFSAFIAITAVMLLMGAGCAPTPKPSPAGPKPTKVNTPGPGGMQQITWRYPQACPQYGAPKNCYVPEGTAGGYDAWAKDKAQFFWEAPPGCAAGKKLVAIKNAVCKYETNGATANAETAISPDGKATVDCRKFAAQYKGDACNCMNGITLSAEFYCE